MDTQRIANEGLILEAVVGSTGYGLNSPDSDEDRMGVCLSPKASFFGFGQPGTKFSHHVSQQPQLDRVVYSLQKFLKLLVKGNPTILDVIFASELNVVHNTKYGEMLRDPDVYQQLISKSSAIAYLGYMDSQMRLLEKAQNATSPNTKRQKLISKYGYDTKRAAHLLRLGIFGTELLTTGRVVMPLKAEDAEWLLDVLGGGVHYDCVMSDASMLLGRIRALKDANVLVEHANLDLASEILYNAQHEFWQS